jgi:hypothetical protein
MTQAIDTSRFILVGKAMPDRKGQFGYAQLGSLGVAELCGNPPLEV